MNSFRKEIFQYVKKEYEIEPDYPWEDKDKESAVLRHPDTGKWFAIVMPAPKRYLGTDTDGVEDVVTMKCDPMLIDALILQKGYYRAFHMNKNLWLTVRLDGTVNLERILDLLAESFSLTEKPEKKQKY